MLLSVLLAFFPKCPLCWAAYMSMFGCVGLARLPYISWLLPVLFLVLFTHLYLLGRKARKNGYIPFAISLAGALIILAGRLCFPTERWVSLCGMGLIISGSLLNSFSGARLPFVLKKSK